MRRQLRLHVILEETIWLVLTGCRGHVFVRIAGEQRPPTCIEITNGLEHVRCRTFRVNCCVAILFTHVARMVI